MIRRVEAGSLVPAGVDDSLAIWKVRMMRGDVGDGDLGRLLVVGWGCRA